MLHHDNHLSRIMQIVCLLLVAICMAIAYSPITRLNFSDPDDHWMLLKNEYVHPGHYSLAYFGEIFGRVNNVQYSPLNTLYYSSIYRINGYDPYYYHLANVIIHFLNSILVFLLTRELLNAFRVSGAIYIAFITWFLWALNSTHVEPVAWISGSKILLCTCFTLCALILFLKGILNGKRIYLILSFTAFIVSFFFKEQAIITPVLCVIFIFFYNLSGQGKITIKGSNLIILLLFFGCSILFGLHTIKVNYQQSSIIPPIHNYPFSQKILLICYCFSFYFYSVIFPFDLHYNYLFPFEPYGRVPWIVYISPLAVMLAIAFYYWLYRKSASFNLYMLLCCFFLVEIFLELQIIPMTRPAIMGDRFMYFPSIPLLITLSKMGYDFFRSKNAIPAYISFLFLVFYAGSLITRTHHIVDSWINFNLIK